MKILVATTTGGLDDQVAPTFGRTPTFTLVEVEDGKITNVEAVPNPAAGAAGGAGVQAAQWTANSGAKAVIAGRFGPNASGILSQAGIELFTVSGMTVREAVERYIRGELPSFSAGNAGPGFGPGMGSGRGMGRSGMGMGMGRGPGMGRRRGMWGQAGTGMMPPSWPPVRLSPAFGFGMTSMTREQELEMLKDQEEMLKEQLRQIRRRLEELRR